ncbi:MAG: ABC transporter ATP-binding protein [Coxiellaceae bacterium]|nr:ABC transporter ATP-binding protein [Coxiellaceae bacterium]
MIEFDNVTKVYELGDSVYEALKGVSFQIKDGEVVAIVGPSGSGKTTTMNLMGLLDHPTSGEYRFNHEPVSHLSSNQLARLRNRTIGFVFQQFHLLPRLTALQNVMMPLYYADAEPRSIKPRAVEALTKVGLGEYYEHKPMELSGGQQQRVAIARALVNNPKIILADEPTGALDTKTSENIMEVLFEHRGETTVVIITHDLEVAEQCPRVIHIRDGVISHES